MLPALSWDTLEKSYPKYPSFSELDIRDDDMHCLMDIAEYVQIGPHVVNGTPPVCCTEQAPRNTGFLNADRTICDSCLLVRRHKQHGGYNMPKR